MALPSEARPPRSPGRATAPSRRQAGDALTARLRAIAAESVAPEDAFEPALRTVLEAAGARAGALCVYDQRHELLWLAAEVGLSDEGCRQLRNARRGSAVTWDMPLHSLLNRRAYLIDSAAKNRYVPPLVDPPTAVRTIACLPLYADATPVGSLVLIALAPQVLREQDLRNLNAATRELTDMVEAVRKRASAAASSSAATAVAPAAAPSPRPAVAGAAAVASQSADDTARLQALSQSLTRAERERERLAASLAAAETERSTTARAQEAVEARVVELTSELEWTRLRLADAEAQAAKAHERACEAERERERAGVALDAATAREHALQGKLDAIGQGASIDDVSTDVRAAEEARDAALADAAAARAALASAENVVRALEAEAAHARAEIAALEQADTREALARELEATRLRLAETEAMAAAAQGRTAEAERERDLAVAALETAAVREKALQGELDAALARAATGADASAVLRAAEEARSAAVAEAAAARAGLASAENVVRALEAEAARAHDEIASLAQADTRETLASELEAARTREQEQRARLGELDAEVARLREEASALAAHASEAARAREDAARRAWEEQRQRLEQEVAAARAHEDEHRTRATALAAEVATLQQECATLRASLAEATRAEDEITRQELDRARAQLEHELEEARSREMQASARLGELEQEVAGAREERAALVVDLETLAADRDRLRDALAALEAERAAPEYVIPVLEEADLTTALEEAVATEPAAGPPPTPAAVPASPSATPPSPCPSDGQTTVVVLDADPGWESAATDRYTVVAAGPADAVALVTAARPTHLIVNLAAPGIFATLAELRAAGVSTPFWGCLADSSANRAIPLGRIEPAPRPLDPEGVLAALGKSAGRGTKVVTVGTDVDSLMSLRQIFTRQGLSVSMAWDVKQAADLFTMIHPTLVVVDLEQPPRVGAGIVARLSAADPLPCTVLISSGEKDPAPGFRTALADPAQAHRALPLARAMSQLINRAESATA